MEKKALGPRLRDQGREALEDLSVLKKLFIPICILTVVYLAGMSAILRANFNYIDDMDRVRVGTQGWGNFSRPLSDFLSTFVHTDTQLTDISPLPQALAALILAAASAVVLYTLTGRTRFSFWEYAAVLPLGLSPYYLECLSYKFDAPYMALSVFATVAPFLFMRSLPRFSLAAFLGTLVFCSCYQASSGIFPMLTVLMAFRLWSRADKPDWRRILSFIGAALAGYAIGMVVFKFCIMEDLTVPGYINKTGGLETLSTTLPPLAQFIPHTVESLRQYFALILGDFDAKWLVLIALICLCFLFTETRDAARSKPLALLMAALSLGVMLVLSFGLYAVMSAPLFLPRSMYGFGAFVAFLAVPAASAPRMLPGKVVCFALSWCFFVFAFTYGNALAAQKTYTEFRIQEVMDAVKTADAVNAPEPNIAAQIDGTIGLAPVLHDTAEKYPVLARLVPIAFSDSSWHWGLYQFAYYYGLPEMMWDSPWDLADMPLPMLDDTMFHTLYGNEHFLYIVLK